MTTETMKWSDKQRRKKEGKTWKLNSDAPKRKNMRKSLKAREMRKQNMELRVGASEEH